MTGIDDLIEDLYGGHKDERLWTQEEAIALCEIVEGIAPNYGCHVALTGGALYKKGPRKDCDILFYRIRQEAVIDTEGLFSTLSRMGIVKRSGFGWCHKALYNGKHIDMFFPESPDGEYERVSPDDLKPVSEHFRNQDFANAGITFNIEDLS